MKNNKFKLDYFKIALTRKCNFDCSFCSQSIDRTNIAISFKDVEKHVLSTYRPRLIILTGGEPLLCPEEVLKFVYYCKSNNVELGLFTNMSLLTEDLVFSFSSLKFFWLRTTINGQNASIHELSYPKNSYKQLLEGILIAKRYGLNIKARVTITKNNYLVIPEIIQSIKELGISEIDFRTYAPIGEQTHDKFMLNINEHLVSIKTIDKVKQQNEKEMVLKFLPNWFEYIFLDECNNFSLCNCGKGYLYINTNGDITSCPSYKQALGNIFSDNILTVYKENKFLELIRKEEYSTYCQNCPKYIQCKKSNCHIINYEISQTFDSTNVLCPIYRTNPMDVHMGYSEVKAKYHKIQI